MGMMNAGALGDVGERNATREEEWV